jgi:hypothetical protein
VEKTVSFENKFENPIFQGILKGKNTQTGEKSFILSKCDHSDILSTNIVAST